MLSRAEKYDMNWKRVPYPVVNYELESSLSDQNDANHPHEEPFNLSYIMNDNKNIYSWVCFASNYPIIHRSLESTKVSSGNRDILLDALPWRNYIKTPLLLNCSDNDAYQQVTWLQHSRNYAKLGKALSAAFFFFLELCRRQVFVFLLLKLIEGFERGT